MKVNLLLFGIARDIAKSSVAEIEVPVHLTVEDLRWQLLKIFPEMGRLKSIMIAVNQEYVSDDHLISEKDEIAVIPPVSGG